MPTTAVALVGMIISMCIQSVLLLQPTHYLVVLVAAIGFFGSAGIVTYAALSQSFPSHLAGRVNTGINTLVFFFAFATQAGMGAIISLFPQPSHGANAPDGYGAAFGAIIAIQIAGLAWYALAPRLFGAKKSRQARG